MKIDDLIKLLQHTKKKLGGDAPVCFFQTHKTADPRKKKVFDFGQTGRDDYCCRITPYETHMYVDGTGVFGIPIREVPRHKKTFTPMKLVETEEEKSEWAVYAAAVRKQFTQGGPLDYK